MKLTFERVAYKNIMSIGSKPVDIDLQSHKRTLITGKNGGGKSTMLEALCFALFGKPFRNIKKNQLINTVNKKALLVELWFNDGKHQYHIKRGIKPNIFEIRKNGEELTEAASAKDFQDMFESEILKMNIQSFKQTIILGTAGYTPFMELPAAQRRALIEDLINLSVYSKMDQLNKAVVKETKANMDAIELKLTGLRNEHSAHMEHIEKQRSMSDAFIDTLKDTYNAQAENAKAINGEIQTLSQEVASVILGDDGSAQIGKYRHAVTLIGGKISQLESNKHFFHSHDTCPTCMQSIKDDWKNTIVGNITKEIDEFSGKLEKTNNTLAELESIQKEYTDNQQKIDSLNKEIKWKKQSLATVLSQAKATKSKIDEAESNVDIDTSRVDELNDEIEALRKDKTDLFEEMYARKIVLNMLKDSGIKAVIMKRYIPVINSKINQYLKALGADYTFTLDQEFNEIIKSRGREDFSYTSFSQGEKARIDLALLFTWRDVAAIVSGTEINLLVLDEVFDGAFDNDAIERVGWILEEMKDKNIFIISHKDHNPDDYDRHIKMVKVGRFSNAEIN